MSNDFFKTPPQIPPIKSSDYISEYSHNDFKEKKDKLSLILSQANSAKFTWNVQSGEISFSDIWAEAIGSNKNEILFNLDCWISLIHPKDALNARALFDSIIKGEFKSDSYTIEYRLKNIDDKWIWIYEKGKIASISADKKPLFIHGLIFDITERKKAEERLERNKSFIFALMDSLPTPIFYKDTKGKYLGFNKAFEKFYGCSKKLLIGKSVFDLNPIEYAEIYNKKDAELFKNKGIQIYETLIKDSKDIVHNVVFHKATTEDADGNATGLIGAILDITERKQMEEALKASEEKYRLIFEHTPVGLIYYDNSGIITECNENFVNIIGSSRDVIIGFNMYNLLDSNYRNAFLESLSGKDGVFEGEYHSITSEKTNILKVVFSPVFTDKNHISGGVGIVEDISEKRLKQQEIEYLSYHDQLTGIYNRRYYEKELHRLDSKEYLPFTVAIGDVNGLKLANDSFGHLTGDTLLIKVAEIIKEACPDNYIVARYGGDEFVILMPNTSLEDAEKTIKSIKKLSSKSFVGSVAVSISFGYATKHVEYEKIEKIFKKAEDRMYKKKLTESPSIRGKTINAIMSALYEKNKREEQHSKRVSLLCHRMGVALHLSDNRIEELKTMGLLHDIGKIAIDENILNKPGKLTQEEWKEIRRHPEIGYRILNTVNDMSEIALSVLSHHERWDGKGYPKGLKGNSIPFAARIIAIADSFDAMTSERSYRPALSECYAIEELKKNAGTQFDPDLVSVFVEKVIDATCTIPVVLIED